MNEPNPDKLRLRVRQLILMRETGPKSSAWHRARMHLIWKLHDRIHYAEQQEKPSARDENTGETSSG